MLETKVYPFNAKNRGQPNYLSKEEKQEFRDSQKTKIRGDGKNITRSDSWYLRYYGQPYLSNISLNEFNRRWADIWDNLVTISDDNKISMISPASDSKWIERFTEMLAESQFRGGVRTDLSRGKSIEQFRSGRRFFYNALPALAKNDKYIYKFGKYEHLKQILDEQVIRLSNSRLYLSANLNDAQKDDENNISFTLTPELLSGIDGLTGVASIDKFKNGLNLVRSFKQDYMMWCAADKYDNRLPYAFDSEAVLIITDKDMFEQTCLHEMKKIGLNAMAKSVAYFDPYLDFHKELDVRFSKHFRFEYQNEYRLIGTGTQLPDHYYLRVPGVKNYTQIFSLTS